LTEEVKSKQKDGKLSKLKPSSAMDDKYLLALIVDHLKKVFSEHKNAPTNVEPGPVILRTDK
jgi:hypothetical protein